MSRIRLRMGLALGPAIVLALALGTAAVATDPGGPPSGDGVDPIFVAGNPSCATLNANNATFPSITGDYGFKLDGAPVGTFTFTNPPGTLTGGAPSDPSNSVTISNVVNATFDWSATMGIDAVIVKGGPDANAFVYVPEDKADTDLHAPVNPSNGDFYGLSHIEFCYDYGLMASKTANAKYTREYSWKITKDYDGEYWKFIGDPATSHGYKVAVDQTMMDYDFFVDGTITIKNPTMGPVSFSVTDYVGTTMASVTCPKYTLAAGETAVCTYSADLGDTKPADGINTATVTSLTTGVDGDTATAAYAFGAPTTTKGYKDINVTDTNGKAWTASGDASWDYTKDFVCPTDVTKYTAGVYSFSHENTAKITETGQYDTALVKVHCYAPIVAKTADTASYDQYYEWTLKKSVDPTSQWGYAGDTLGWKWTVKVTATGLAADKPYVSGVITVKNPHPDAAMTVGLTDKLSDGTVATISPDADCAYAAGMLTVPKGGTATCDYKATPTGVTATYNEATVTLNALSFTAKADVKWAAVDMNAKATVTDTQIGLNKELTGPGTWTFDKPYDHTCSMAAKDYGADGTYSKTIDNEAKLVIAGDGTLTSKASTTYTCKAGFMDLLKLTEGVVDATMKWNFALYKGPDGFGTTPIGTGTTFEDADGVLHFGHPALRPDKTYTVCELAVPAGWNTTWEVNGVPVTPYDPDQNNTIPEDLGNRCVDFGAGTAIPVKVGETVHFKVDNSYPGGDPRTPGYWKNWNMCTKGNQAATAAANGGWEEGFWLLEDVFTVNGPIVWDDILTDDVTFTIKTCAVAVDLLDKRLVADPALVGDGKKVASKPLHNLATHLLAAQLNFGAGACTTPTVLEKAYAAEKLLDKYDFKGTLTYKMPLTTTDAATAKSLATYLDNYNNGMYCGSTMP